jgi:integrase
MRTPKPLTVNFVKAVKEPGTYPDGKGLRLVVTETGARHWVFRYWMNKRERKMGLGPADLVTLEEARDAAHEARKLRRSGMDPIAERRSRRVLSASATTTFQKVTEDYYEAQSPKWRNPRTRVQWIAVMRQYVFPKIGALPIGAVDETAILGVLKPIWDTKYETARRLRPKIEAVLDMAKVMKLRTGDNPARWEGHFEHLLSKPPRTEAKHHSALPWKDIPSFMAKLRDRESNSARALEFLILTCVRSGEVRHATWDQIENDEVWTIAPPDTKTGIEFRVPLSSQAQELLNSLPREGNSIFGIRDRDAMRKLAKQIGFDVTPHGMRASFRTWAAECTNFPHELCEAALAHVVGNATYRAYQRGDLFNKRRKVMEAWGRFCASPPGAAAEVIPMRAKA